MEDPIEDINFSKVFNDTISGTIKENTLNTGETISEVPIIIDEKCGAFPH